MSNGKNLLLINPWIYDFTAYDLWSKPLGLLYLASFLRSNGFNIAYIDCLVKSNKKKYGVGNFRREIVSKPDILSDIPRHFARYGMSEADFRRQLNQVPYPDCILLTSGMTYWYPGLQHVVQILKEVFPGIPVILGGIYATLMPAHAKKTVKPDYLISGPGELATLDLLNSLFNLPNGLNFIPNTLDDYPYPAFDLQTELDYLVLMTARGCPYDCSFCAQKHISMPFTQRKPDKVIDEIVYHYQKFRIRDIAFYDDALFIGRDRHIKQILKKLIDLKLPLRFHTPNGLFAKLIDEELADLMYRANFKTVRLSFETSNEARREDMNNKISNSGMEDAIHNLIQAGYKAHEVGAYVIMGLPQQDLKEILASMVFINNRGLKVRLSSFSPIPGTRDFERAVDLGYIDRDIDPLLTNKSIFPLRNESMNYDVFRQLRAFGQLLNDAAQKQFRPFSDSNIGSSLAQVLRNLN